MRKIVAVTRREFLTRVRSKAFIWGTILGPVILGALFITPILLEKRSKGVHRIALLDGTTGGVGERLAQSLSADNPWGADSTDVRYDVVRVPADGRMTERLDSLVALTDADQRRTPEFTGVLAISDSSLFLGKVKYVGVDVSSQSEMSKLSKRLQRQLVDERLRRAGVDPEIAREAGRPVRLETARASKGTITSESGESSFFLAYFMAFTLYLALLLHGMGVMTSVVEEKTSRIVEVLISSLKPFELMLGKIFGVGGAGLLQLGIWGGTVATLSAFREEIARLFGISPAELAALQLPTMKPDLLAVFLLFFLLGFFLYAAAYAALGSMCSTPQEVQMMQSPVSIFIMAGFISMFALLKEPSGPLAQKLTYVPVLAPFVTPVRYSLSAITPVEVMLSALVTFLGLLAVTWVAAKIYRVGILNFGKRSTFSEAWRWVRA